MKHLAVVSVLSLTVALLFGCSGATDYSSAAPVTEHKIAPAEVGTKAVCPVLKTPITVSETTLAMDYKGKTYYFCCADCPPKFKANPEKYAVPAPASPATETH